MFLGPVGDDPQSVEVKRLAIRPGDYLVIRVSGYLLSEAEADEIKANVHLTFKKSGYVPPVLLLEGGTEIGVIGPEASEAAGVVKQAALEALLGTGFDPANARAVLGVGPVGS
jgi:hypothetical protein